MQSEHRAAQSEAPRGRNGRERPRKLWKVSVRDLKKALEAEIGTLEERSGLLGRAREKLTGRRVPPLEKTESSRLRYLQRLAQMSVLRQLGGERLTRAEAALKKARAELDEITVAVDKHNGSVDKQGVFKTIVLVLPNHLSAHRLGRRRDLALRRYRDAERDLEEVFLWIRDQGNRALGEDIDRQAFRQGMAMLYQYRSMEIERSFVHDELALRRELRERLEAIDDDTPIYVRNRELADVVRDPLLNSRIDTLVQEQQGDDKG